MLAVRETRVASYKPEREPRRKCSLVCYCALADFFLASAQAHTCLSAAQLSA